MPFDPSAYLIEIGDTRELVEKINDALGFFATVVNNTLPIVAMAALEVNWTAGDYFSKSISTSSEFTFANVPASAASSITLELTKTASGTETWPAVVEWPYDQTPSLDDGYVHLIQFISNGTRVFGAVLQNYPLP